jgi:hypothetical protein
MTIENRIVFDLTEIKGVIFECNSCGARISVRPGTVEMPPQKCPADHWWNWNVGTKYHSSESPFRALLSALAELQNSLYGQIGFKILLEISEARFKRQGLERRFFHLTGYLRISKTLPGDLREDGNKPIRVIKWVVFGGAIVEAKHLFGHIAVKMKWLDSNISSIQGALQKAPEVIDSLSMNMTTNVLFNMVHGRVNVILRGQVIVARIAVSVDGSAVFDLAENLCLKSFAFPRSGPPLHGPDGTRGQASP